LSKDKELAAALARYEKLQRSKCFDPFFLKSRPTPAQQEVITDFGGQYRHQWVVAANQTGKSQLGGRIVSWFFEENHPNWKRPEAWGDTPLLIIVIGRVMNQVDELWEKKIKPFLGSSEYKINRPGGVLDSVVCKKTGNKILFMSHNAPKEAREKVQSYVANMVWLDEMPGDYKLVEELQKRIISRSGYFLATFTPKVRNELVRQMAEAEIPHKKMYKFRMLDNPVFFGREEEIIAEHAHLPESYRRAVMEGDWYVGDSAVYDFQHDTMVQNPPGYHPSWRHVEAIDPAASSKAGFVLLAEDPSSGIWYIVRADYIDGAAATTMLDKIEPLTYNYNIARRVSDPNASWFIKEAALRQRYYRIVEKKSERKKELIKQLQEKLYDGTVKIAPWCTHLLNEIGSCQWSETVADKIVGAQRFHLLDAVQYGLDILPRGEVVSAQLTHDQYLKEANKLRKKREAAAKLKKVRKRWSAKPKRRGRRSIYG
jgi:hypothetical protein